MGLYDELKRIVPADEAAMEQARLRWNRVAKPLHSLGGLEDAVVRIAGAKASASFRIRRKALVIMCADNGVVAEGVTQTGQEVTAVVTENFTRNEASVCLMAGVAGADLFPVDIGVAADVPGVTCRRDKVMYGTKNMMEEPAMSREQAEQAVLTGINTVERLAKEGYEILATGEMGIGNTTTSSAVVSVLLRQDADAVAGRGAGLSREGLERKRYVIRESIRCRRPDREDVLDVLSKVGGLDIAGLAGVFLGGAIFHIPVLIDGFISSAAALCAVRLAPESAGYMLASHRSAEPAGGMVLEELGLCPLIDCGMSLGEGSGAVAAMPLLDMGTEVYEKMSTFEEISVKQYEELK